MKGKIFNAQEVQAIIAGNKTIFREVIKPCKQHPKSLCKKTRRAHYNIDFTENGLFWRPYGGSELQPFPYCDGKLSASNSLDEFCPYQVGQKIFCKESFATSLGSLKIEDVKYLADQQKLYGFFGRDDWKKRPAQQMKQEHSRLTLEITNIKVERLGEISEDDAIKEGIPLSNEFKDRYYTPENNYAVPKIAFMRWWNATHKKPEEKFDANPFVWVVNFKINN